MLHRDDSLSCSEVYRSEADATAIEKAWKADVGFLRARLRDQLEKPEIAQALVIASPSLQAGIEAWKRDPESKKGLQAERSLVRYLSRMAGRSTPFGLFSGCSVGGVQLDADTLLELAPRAQYRTVTRLDFDYLFELTSTLRSDPALQVEMRYGWNSSLHRVGCDWHYVESRLSGASRTHHLVKFASDEYIVSVLSVAKNGNSSFAEMVTALRSCHYPEPISDEEIDGFIREMIANEILVPDLVPLLTGKPALDDLLDQLRGLPSAIKVFNTLSEIKVSLSTLDSQPIGASPEEYQAIALKLKTLPVKIDDSHLFQVDMFKPMQNANLGRAIFEEIYAALAILGRFGTPSEPNDLKLFRDGFTRRYEEEWVPLVQALDLEAGIGYGLNSAADGSPILRGLPLRPNQLTYHAELNEFQSFLLQKIIDCARTGKEELVLEVKDLPAAKDLDELVPESFAVMARLVSSSTEALRKDEFVLVFKGGYGPSCARMLGRFCAGDSQLDSLVRAALREEELQDPESVYAEVVYLPEGRIGNVLSRPVLRNYEIVHLGRSGAPKDRQLPIADLLVSVRNGEIILYSQRLRCRVVPRMSNAHGYSRAGLSQTYRFLCDLQSQRGLNVPTFSWGPLARISFLPRVRVGRTVLAPAQWRISTSENKALCDIDRCSAFCKIKDMQRKRGFPRWVMLAEGDNTLPVDLDNPLSVDAFLQVLKRSPEATIIEMYPPPLDECVRGPEGAYEHELLIPLVKRRLDLQANRGAASYYSKSLDHVDSTRCVRRTDRLLLPGSDWLFLKIYGGYASLDDLLLDKVAPLLSSLSSHGTVARWFFVRYSDPDPHLRLRIQMVNRAESAGIFHSLQSLLTDERFWKVQLDTYRREIERYGGAEGMSISEDVFCADSDAVLEILQALDGEDVLDKRWRIALLGVDTLLVDSGCDLTDKLRLMKKQSDLFIAEFNLSSEAKHAFGERFRGERAQLHSILHRGSVDKSGCYRIAYEAFAKRSERIRKPLASLRNLEKHGALACDYFEIIGSYVHMHLNRIIRSAPRAHELVLYHLLHRLYDSERARERRQVPNDSLAAAESSR